MKNIDGIFQTYRQPIAGAVETHGHEYYIQPHPAYLYNFVLKYIHSF